jgi:hypothetical protein
MNVWDGTAGCEVMHAIYQPLVPPVGIVNLATVSYLLQNLPGKVPWLHANDVEMLAIAVPTCVKEPPLIIGVPAPNGVEKQYVLCAELSDTELFVHPVPNKTGTEAPTLKCRFRLEDVDLIECAQGWRVIGPLVSSAWKVQSGIANRKVDAGLGHVIADSKFRVAASRTERGAQETIGDLQEVNMNADVLSWRTDVRQHTLNVFVIWRASGRHHCRQTFVRHLLRACSG